MSVKNENSYQRQTKTEPFRLPYIGACEPNINMQKINGLLSNKYRTNIPERTSTNKHTPTKCLTLDHSITNALPSPKELNSSLTIKEAEKHPKEKKSSKDLPKPVIYKRKNYTNISRKIFSESPEVSMDYDDISKTLPTLNIKQIMKNSNELKHVVKLKRKISPEKSHPIQSEPKDEAKLEPKINYGNKF